MIGKMTTWNAWITGENGLDAVEDERDGEERAEVGHRARHGLAAREQVAQAVADAEHEHGARRRHEQRQRRHHHHRERRRPRVARAQLVAHPHAAYEHVRLSFTSERAHELTHKPNGPEPGVDHAPRRSVEADGDHEHPSIHGHAARLKLRNKVQSAAAKQNNNHAVLSY
jgi:hypothetical protein